MNCQNCNKFNSEDSMFCKFCGYNLKNFSSQLEKKQKIWEKTWFRILLASVIGLILIIFLPRFFYFLLSVYGFLTFLYLISLFLKSIQPLKFIIEVITIIFAGFGYLSVLYMYYIALKMLFEGYFFWGLILIIIGVPLFQFLPLLINLFLALIIIGPGYFFLEDLEKRFKKNII